MATDWKQILRQGAVVAGRGLWWALQRFSALLVQAAGFIHRRAIPAAWAWLRGSALPALRRFYRWLPHRRRVLAGIAAALALAVGILAWPGGEQPQPASRADASAAAADVEHPGEPVVVTVSPGRAAPGAPLVLAGLPTDTAGDLHVLVGGRPAPMQRLRDGSLRILVPLHPGVGGWPEAPAGDQRVEVRRGESVVATGDRPVEILELPRAPGTTAAVQRSLETIADGYGRILEDLPAHSESERANRRAVLAMLRGLVSEGEMSLAAVLAGSSPLLEGAAVDLELTDALLASSGAAAYLEAYASALSSASGHGTGATRGDSGGLPGRSVVAAARSIATEPFATTGGLVVGWLARNFFPLSMDGVGGSAPVALLGVVPVGPGQAELVRAGAGTVACRNRGDRAFEIACLMQAHALLSLYSETFVRPLAEGYANTMGLAAGAMGVFGSNNPLPAIVGALLTVTDFVISKVSLSLLPARLEPFEMRVSKDLLAVGEITRATVEVTARNTPMTVTMGDLVGLVSAFLGPLGPSDKLHDTLKNVFTFTIDLYQAALRASGAPSTTMGAGVFTMPPRQWGPARVTSDELVTLFSVDEDIVATRREHLEWQARNPGKTRVRAETAAAGARSKVLLDNSLCLGCVWTGGAFGDEMRDVSWPVAVGVELTARPHQGKAPLRVDLSWKLAEPPEGDHGPVPCTIDFGDGSAPEHIADCRETTSIRHVYPYTSRLEETGGAYVPTISLGGSRPDGSAEVFTEWTFRGSPGDGQVPVDARFNWNIPWPADRAPPRCEFDPGDGSARQAFDDCLATTRAEHTFERRGSFAPSLTIMAGGARDTKTAPVSVSEPGVCDEGLLKARRWKGTVSYSQSRNVWHPRSNYHVQYAMQVDFSSADLEERTRRTDRGGDYLVQYYTGLPGGSAQLDISTHSYSDRGLESYETFTGGNGLLAQTPDMVEDGSTLSLVLNAKKCTFHFYLQGQTGGSGERWRRGHGNESYTGHHWIHSVRVEGTVDSNHLIAGSAAIPVMTRTQIEDNRIEKDSWVSEFGSTASALQAGGSGLGTVTVTWNFTPVD